MYHYRIHGLTVASDFKLESALPIPEVGESERDIWIHEGFIDPQLTTETEEEIANELRFSYRYEKARGWVRVLRVGCFIMLNGNEVIYSLKEGFNTIAVSELLSCMCLSVVMIQRERLMIHGSCILRGDKAVIISGQSGSGKSTLAHAMLQNGGVFMADDSAVVSKEEDCAYVYPALPQQRLCSDAVKSYRLEAGLIPIPNELTHKEKYAIRIADNFCAEKKELGAIIIIQADENEPTGYIQKINGSEKLKYFTENLFRYKDYGHIGFSHGQFRESVWISNHIDIYRLVRPVEGLDIEDELKMVTNVLDSL